MGPCEELRNYFDLARGKVGTVLLMVHPLFIYRRNDAYFLALQLFVNLFPRSSTFFHTPT